MQTGQFVFRARMFSNLALVAATMLCGCATELTFRRRESLDYFVGKERTALVARLGEPSRVEMQDGKELLVYDRHELKWVPGQPDSRNDIGTAQAPWVADVQCTTTFRVDAGHVDAWRLEGNDCRNQDFPPLGATIADSLERVRDQGVDHVANFPHSAYTARSGVNYGQFYSN